MSVRDKINQRMDVLQAMMEDNVHLDRPDIVEQHIQTVSKFWSVLSDEDMGDAEAMIHQEGENTFFLAIAKTALEGPVDDIVTLLIHEMVHVRQYIRKQITDRPYNNFEEYLKLPYEQEAYKLQEEMLDEIKAKVFND